MITPSFRRLNRCEWRLQNPGGSGADAMGMGMGFVMAQQMGQALNQQAQTPTPISSSVPKALLRHRRLPQAVSYYVAVAGKQTGPFPMEQLQQQAQNSQLTRESLVWTQGMAQWTPAAQVAALASLFAHLPPPIPGA